MNLCQFIRRLKITKEKNVTLARPIMHLGKMSIRCSSEGKLKIGSGFSCRDDILFNISQGEVDIGDNVFLNDGIKINCRKRIVIGDCVIMGQNVLLYDHDHDYTKGKDAMISSFKEDEIIIGNNVWIGSNVVILRGSHIGSGCVIGAGAVIKGDIPDNMLVYSQKDLIMKELRVN